MSKLYEFVNNDKSIQLLDSFLFFDEQWLFVENRDFFVDEIDEKEIDFFIEVGKKLANNLNKSGVSVDDYDEIEILNYLKSDSE